nr:DUF4271 domain-containing protein [Membranihabitans marinus]
MASLSSSVYGQNPFEIKSRKNINSTKDSVSPVDRPSADTIILKNSTDNETPELEVIPESEVNQIPRPSINEKDKNAFNINPPSDSGTALPEIEENIPPLDHDSVTESIIASPAKDTEDEESLLNKILPQDTSENQEESITHVEYWAFILDLLLLLLTTGLFLYDREIFNNIRKASVQENLLRYIYRDMYIRKPYPFYYLNIIYLLGFSYFIYKVGVAYKFDPSFINYLIILACLTLLFFIKHILLHILSNISDNSFEIKFYQYWLILFSGLMGIIIIPVILMLSVFNTALIKNTIIILGILVILLYLYRLAKSVIHGRFYITKHVFHFFLYFCAVEIIPLCLVYRFLTPF